MLLLNASNILIQVDWLLADLCFNSFKTFYFSIILDIISSLIQIVGLLIAVAFYTLAERKVMAAVQRRKGPNVVGF